MDEVLETLIVFADVSEVMDGVGGVVASALAHAVTASLDRRSFGAPFGTAEIGVIFLTAFGKQFPI